MVSLYPLVDLTYLKDEETEARALIEKANDLELAALCLSPQFVRLGCELSQHPIATVCNFPSGNQDTQIIIDEIAVALDSGASELDIVLPYETILVGNHESAFSQLARCLDNIPRNIITKIIIETCVFDSPQLLSDICKTLIEMDINFIKTSTGMKQGADISKSSIILDSIQRFDSSATIGFKASGGIRSISQAQSYYQLACDILGEKLTSKRFRIGASQLN